MLIKCDAVRFWIARCKYTPPRDVVLVAARWGEKGENRAPRYRNGLEGEPYGLQLFTRDAGDEKKLEGDLVHGPSSIGVE